MPNRNDLSGDLHSCSLYPVSFVLAAGAEVFHPRIEGSRWVWNRDREGCLSPAASPYAGRAAREAARGWRAGGGEQVAGGPVGAFPLKQAW